LEVGKKPLFVIDGKPFGTYLSLDDIDASKVESATLLDKTEAMKLYGEKAKDGALVITSKHPERNKVHHGVQFNVPSTSDKKFKVSGQVVEYPSHKPVPGASIIIRGTTMGTLADKDGRFELQVKEGDVLIISYVGLQTTSVPVQKAFESNWVIHLREEIQSMDEMTVVAMAPEEKQQAVKTEPVKTEKGEEVIFQVVEQMPEFPGGMGEAMKFLAKNMKYPVSAQQAKIEGRVIVQFVVERDGSVSDVKVMRGVSPELDAEAIRVVSMMPKWIPGKQRSKAVAVKYTMPIMFRLQTPEPKKEEAFQINLRVDKDVTREDVDMVKDHLRSSYSVVPIVLDDDRKNPIIIVDGEVKEGMNLSQISPATIKSISVMKNEAAIAEYGDKAKDGVISIVTKKNKE
jgi:TonB family protein